MELYLMFGLDS